MEELRSTEVLDKEILEDARKKAFKILKTADDALGAQKRDWDKKIQDALESARKTYAERIERTGGEIMARLPLEKKRLRSENTEKSLLAAMNDFLRGLTREQLLSIMERELRYRFGALASGEKGNLQIPEAQVSFSGLSSKETRDLLEKALSALGRGRSSADAFKPDKWEFKEDADKHEFPSIVINTPPWKLITSVEDAAAALMKDKRAELTAALLGEGALND